MNNNELNELIRKSAQQNSSGNMLAAAILLLVLTPLMLIYGVWANAYVGSTLWAWFIVPTFGLPALTIPQAWGVSLLVSMWTKQWHTCKSKDERSTAEKVMEAVVAIISPWLFLLYGWVCYNFFMVAK